MSLLLNGIGVSRGIAIGQAHLYQQQTPEVTEKRLPHEALSAEIKRFKNALKFAKREFTQLRNRIPDSAPADFSSFIDTYVLMLEDNLLSQTPVQLIRNLCCNAEWALKMLHEDLVATFDAMEDPYLRTRRDDVTHVIEKLQRILTNQQYTSEPAKGEIIVASNLSAAEIADLHDARVSGIITEFGGPLSHAAILMRSLAIPAVVGVANSLQLINNGEVIVLDGESGLLLANVPHTLQQHFRKKQQIERKRRATLAITPHYPSITRDGTRIALQANIELDEDLVVLRRQESTDVGLYRTEFLYANYDNPPDEAEQLKVYRKALRALRGKSLTIRTCDMGGDKLLGTENRNSPLSPNPALGLRAIRLSLREPDGFAAQVRAILRTSSYGPVRMMLPMVTDTTELDQCLALIDEQRQALHKSGYAFDPNMPIGVMIEVPAAALIAGAFARRLDFLSIGTNDLIQYTLAIDRTDETVTHLYDPTHPAVLKLIKGTLEEGIQAGIPVAMCGEMAGDPRYTRLLLGMGLKEFSVPVNRLAEINHIICNSDISRLRATSKNLITTMVKSKRIQLLNQINEGLEL